MNAYKARFYSGLFYFMIIPRIKPPMIMNGEGILVKARRQKVTIVVPKLRTVFSNG